MRFDADTYEVLSFYIDFYDEAHDPTWTQPGRLPTLYKDFLLLFCKVMQVSGVLQEVS